MCCYLGYIPNFVQCINCGKKEELVAFSLKSKGIKCNECSEHKDLALKEGTIAAIRYIIRSDTKSVFSFNVTDEVLKEIDIFRKIYMEIVKE